ncbi:MAG: 6-phosphofructokinase [Eubacteriales bacterium]
MTNPVGNAVVGQSGGPTAAINATLSGVIRGVLGGAGGNIRRLYGMRNGIEGLLARELVDLTAFFGGNEEKLRSLERTPAAALGSCRKKLPDPDGEDADGVYERLLGIFREYDIRYFFYIGGNDSMDTVAKLSGYTEKHGYEMRIIGVPKTIDNDLDVTDHTPGFGSAAKYIATVTQEIIRDCAVYKIPAVTVIEIMGRDAGWLTAASAAGQSHGFAVPDAVYLPEAEFDNEKLFADVKAALDVHPNVVIAVSEGIRYAGGKYVGESAQNGAVDVFGHSYLAGTGKVLAQLIKERFGCKTRAVELNLPQRCASHIASATDIAESVLIGKSAVEAAEQGVSRSVMTFVRNQGAEYGVEIGHCDVLDVANRVKHVPPEFINAAGNGITDACCEYLLPLIGGESYPEYENGLPVFLVL